MVQIGIQIRGKSFPLFEQIAIDSPPSQVRAPDGKYFHWLTANRLWSSHWINSWIRKLAKAHNLISPCFKLQQLGGPISFSPFLSSSSPSLLPVHLSFKRSQICGSIIKKYTPEDVMPFEKCLHALIFPGEEAGLPFPQGAERDPGFATHICIAPEQLDIKSVCRGSYPYGNGRKIACLFSLSSKNTIEARSISIIIKQRRRLWQRRGHITKGLISKAQGEKLQMEAEL